MTWAVVATVKEAPEATLRFAAHHLVMGASEVRLYFDDPADPAIAPLSRHPRAFVRVCDDARWAEWGSRPGTIEWRQRANANDAYRNTSADWIIHCDADEFVETDRPVEETLAAVEGPVLRLPPWEMLDFARAGRGGDPTHMFRGVVTSTARNRKFLEDAYGPFHECLRNGMLSHSSGKYFVRTGLKDVQLKIHAPAIGGETTRGVATDGARLLHVHGGSWSEWRAKLDFRLQDGAYRRLHDTRRNRRMGAEGNLAEVLGSLFDAEGEDGLRRFFSRVCRFDAGKRRLARIGALHQTCLWLDQKRADVFGGEGGRMRDMAVEGESGRLEGDVLWRGAKLRIAPGDNVTERLIALGREPEPEETSLIADLVRGRRVLFHDVGANAGLYSVLVGTEAAEGSRIKAYEPNPEMVRRLRRNLALNGLEAEVRPVALSSAQGAATLAVHPHDHGKGAIDPGGDGETPAVLTTFAAEAEARGACDLVLLKIDVEGHEADALATIGEVPEEALPDAILIEVAWRKRWSFDILETLAALGYREAAKTRENLFLLRAKVLTGANAWPAC